MCVPHTCVHVSDQYSTSTRVTNNSIHVYVFFYGTHIFYLFHFVHVYIHVVLIIDNVSMYFIFGVYMCVYTRVVHVPYQLLQYSTVRVHLVPCTTTIYYSTTTPV